MGTLGKFLALSVGVFGGGGLGFYLQENYYLKRNEEKRDELEKELNHLRNLRRTKEEKLRERLKKGV